MALIFDLEQELEFHNVTYLLHAFVSDDGSCLTITAEHKITGDRWSGVFSAEEVEKMTHKTGNFKKFPIFVKMLSTAMLRNTSTVVVDLLTYSDLEMLKARKTGQPSSSSNSRGNNKRYIILTYAVEFDRVHYPLPLKFEAVKDPESMKATIERLRNELQEVKSSQGRGYEERNGGSSVANPFKIELNRLADENRKLKQLLKSQGRRSSSSADQDTIAALQEEIAELTHQLKDHERRMKRGGLVDGKAVARKTKELERELFNAAATLRKEKLLNAKVVNKSTRENSQLATALDKAQKQVVALKKSNTKLTEECKDLRKELRLARLKSSGRASTPRSSSRASSRPGSRSTSRLGSRPSSRSSSRNTSRSPAPAKKSSFSRPSSASRLRSRSNTPTNTKKRTGRSPSPYGSKSVYGQSMRPLNRSQSASKNRSGSATKKRPSSARSRSPVVSIYGNGSAKKKSFTRPSSASTRNTRSSSSRLNTSRGKSTRVKSSPRNNISSSRKVRGNDYGVEDSNAKDPAYDEEMSTLNAWSLERARSRGRAQREKKEVSEDTFADADDIADIDTRINKLQQFLQAAKTDMNLLS